MGLEEELAAFEAEIARVEGGNDDRPKVKQQATSCATYP